MSEKDEYFKKKDAEVNPVSWRAEVDEILHDSLSVDNDTFERLRAGKLADMLLHAPNPELIEGVIDGSVSLDLHSYYDSFMDVGSK